MHELVQGQASEALGEGRLPAHFAVFRQVAAAKDKVG